MTLIFNRALIADKYSISSQTSYGCKVALEILEDIAIKTNNGKYKYIETGSYLGGTLLPRIMSLNCNNVLSIDKRVDIQPDERRASGYSYKGVSTYQMKARINDALADKELLNKLSCFDGTISEYVVMSQKRKDMNLLRFDWCFIDAEHTNIACFDDFCAALQIISNDGFISFHDSWMTFSGIVNINSMLKLFNKEFAFVHIHGNVSAFFFGKSKEIVENDNDYMEFFISKDINEFSTYSKKKLLKKQRREILKSANLFEYLKSIFNPRDYLKVFIKYFQINPKVKLKAIYTNLKEFFK